MNKWRTIWISDVHMGTKSSQAAALLRFLQNNSSEQLYIVGDFIDFWRLQAKLYWNSAFNEVLAHVIAQAADGTSVFLIPGNHDEYLRKFDGFTLGDIEIVNECVHRTADGREILILHGDKFDGITRYARWLAVLGSWGYEILIGLNTSLNWCRRKLGLPYWSLSANVKRHVKQAVNFISNFELAIVHECEKNGYNAILCGHIHQAAIKQLDSITYYNTGDWVESCTCIVEDWDGKMYLLDKDGNIWQGK